MNKQDVEKYFSIREISGISKNWLCAIKKWINKYLEFIDYKIDESATLEYLKNLKDSHSICFYRKKTYQICCFLHYLKCDWVNNIKLPQEPVKKPIRIGIDDIQKTLDFFKGNSYEKQFNAIIHLGKDSGMRAGEIYQLKPEDIDLDNRIIHINHNPSNGQTTKTKQSRISFFSRYTQKILKDYIEYFNNGSVLLKLFSQTHIERGFANAPIRVKHLRKYFSQEWDRRGGQTSIKKLIMGHSIKKDVDLMHYNCQSEEDLKKIYDKVMGES